MNLEEFVRRGRAAQKAVNKLTDTTPEVDFVALVKECRMGLSVMLDKDDMDYDPSDQARELIGRIDRIVDELAIKADPITVAPDVTERYRSALEAIATGDETSTVAGAVAIAQQALEREY